MQYEVVIGLEIHAQVQSNTKIFCSCPTSFGDSPNSHTCPVCLALPGALPVLNQRVVEQAIRAGLAIEARINPFSEFARKNYFYPDLPKGYQISQFEYPIVSDGRVQISLEDGSTKQIRVERIHMEEDAGKSLHGSAMGRPGSSYIDLNRAGTPLLEIVSDPDMRSAAEAQAYARAIKALLEYTGVCDCNMERGNLRFDVNISLRPRGQAEYGTRAEIKNLNSFRNLERAIEYETLRQADILDSGEAVVQETRLFDVERGVTLPMRSKEEAHDYRYFPDPDLIPVHIERELVEHIRADMPELPAQRRQRYMDTHGLSAYDAEVLTADRAMADWFEAALAEGAPAKQVANWVMGEVQRVLNERSIDIQTFEPRPLMIGKLVQLVEKGTISNKIAKQVFEELCANPRDPEQIVKDKGLVQMSDEGAIAGMIDEVIAANPDPVEQYRQGQTKVLGFLVGQVMKASRGKANPGVVNKLLRQRLES